MSVFPVKWFKVMNKFTETAQEYPVPLSLSAVTVATSRCAATSRLFYDIEERGEGTLTLPLPLH